MSVSEELQAMIGDGPDPEGSTVKHAWHQVCVCGHLRGYHSESVGGTSRRPLGLPQRAPYAFHGCRGELSTRNFERTTVVAQSDGPPVIRENPTCPCEEFRAVAECDRPGRYFNQRRPRDRADASRHPFMTGMRAVRTRLGKLRAVDGDPVKRDAEFDRRFRWLDGARICSISACKATDDVWPVFVNADDRSELRCPKHR